LHLITLNDFPLDEGSARRIDFYLHKAQNLQEIDIHVPGWIRIHNLSKRADADSRLRPRGHRDRCYVVI